MRAELAALLALAGCSSAPLAPEARAVVDAGPALAWREATAADLDGLFEAQRIEGEAAAALRRLWYHFASDGSYSGAALVFDGERTRFQTLSGQWTLSAGHLELEGGAPSRVQAAEGWLRIESESGLALLRRIADA